MIIHHNVFSFDPAMTEAETKQFFDEMQQVVEGSGLATSFTHQPHLPIPPMDAHSPVFTVSAVAEIAVPDLDAVGSLANDPSLGEFIGRWQARRPYKVVWYNTQQTEPSSR